MKRPMLSWHFLPILTILAILPVLLAAHGTRTANTPPGKVLLSATAEPEVALLSLEADGITLIFKPESGQPGFLEAELCELDGESVAGISRRHDGRPFEVTLPVDRTSADASDFYLRYRLHAEEAFQQRSLFFLSPVLETIVLAQKEYLAGSTPKLRVLVNDRTRGVPLADATVMVTLSDQHDTLLEREVRTNLNGEATVRLQIPAKGESFVTLDIAVTAGGATDQVTERIAVKSATRTLLTTDKPMYQPGQTIRMRALSLQRPGLTPLRDTDVLFEVSDAKGNKVFKQRVKTDSYGVSHAEFVLASELNEGAYRVSHTVGELKEEKSVTVERYVLPKFKIALQTDRKFYLPGQTIKGTLQADYFFGKPVAEGDIHISCSQFDVAFQEFQTIEGETDANGHFAFEVPLPDHFVGQPVEAGQASVKLDVSVIDGAEHREGVTRLVSVTTSPVVIAVVPEAGKLIPGLENRIYIVTTYADGTPAACTVDWLNPPGTNPILGSARTITTDAGGFGEFTFTPGDAASISLELRASDARGNRSRSTVTLDVQRQPGDDRLLLQLDRALCKVGDALKLSVVSTRQNGMVYVDMIKDRQTSLTTSSELRNGRARVEIPIGPELAGTIQVSAYLIGDNGVIVRDRRVVVVDPANDLQIEITADHESYRPGQQAQLRFEVKNRDGEGVATALGISVVDEAVFALQEMQPGFEKVYFYLEREIAKPRYEIHGHDLNEIMPVRWDGPVPGDGPEKRTADHPLNHPDYRGQAARVLLASAQEAPDPNLVANTFQKQNKFVVYNFKSALLLSEDWGRIYKALEKYAEKLAKQMSTVQIEDVTLGHLVRAGELRRNETIDPWGTEYRIAVQSHPRGHRHLQLELQSAGVDGLWNTADDTQCLYRNWRQYEWQKKRKLRAGKKDGRDIIIDVDGNEMDMRQAFDVVIEMPMREKRGLGGLLPMAARPRDLELGFEIAAVEEGLADQAGIAMRAGELRVRGGSSGEVRMQIGPRVRKYFPETLFFEPALITDRWGRATLDIPLADSITEWRLSCFATSATGELGSTSQGLRVFQDFFVDIDFPVALTQHDRVSVPVAIYNYLKVPQRIRLVVEEDDWFDLEGPAEQVVDVAPGQVTAIYFPITATGINFQKFTVFGYGSEMSDAVSRSVQIEPDGKEQLVSFSGRLSGNLQHTVTIPAAAVPDASTLLVKIFPGMLSQVLEGLDGMLRMPHGCFEQTSAVTYPNILVLDYLKATDQLTPEVQMEAEGFINNGYQRLLSFEVAGGGFEWFGNAPAHRILTAYGLMEFHDMSKVHPLDDAVITRTQQWLANGQEDDGSFRPSEGGIREGAINKFTDDVLRTTAYVTWALAHTGFQGHELSRAVDYIAARLDQIEDNFTLALVANALVTVASEGAAQEQVLAQLVAARTEEGDLVFWPCDSETPTHGRGESTSIEVTGLAVQALVKAGREPGVVGKAVAYLAGCKDAFGSWHTTQATIQALRGMLAAERAMPSMSVGEVTIALNGEKIETLTIDEDSADLLRLVDLGHVVRTGDNSVELRFAGEGALMYQVAGRYYIPREREMISDQDEPLAIDLDYDRTRLATDDILNVTAQVAWQAPGRAKMVIVDLGLPPGFTLLPEQLNQLVAEKKIQKYETTGRQIIVYLDELSRGKPLTISYQLLAKYPLKAKTVRSSVYEYYNPQSRAEVEPVEISVVEG